MIYTYGRVSTDKQENSLDLQRRINNEFSTRLFGRLPDVELYDHDSSGKFPVLRRANGVKLTDLKKGDIVICMKHDRMFRNMANGVVTVEKWFKEGVSLYFINLGDQPIDMNNPEKKFQFYIMLATAVLERDNIAKRTKDGIRQRKISGKTYSPAPYGFDNVYDKNELGDRINGKLVPNPEEQKVVKRIKELVSMKVSYEKIAETFNSESIPTKKGKKWSKFTIFEILKNDIHDKLVA